MLTSDPLLISYISFWLLVFGACVGSFADCMALRVAGGESILRGRSKCDHCGAALSPLDLIPVVSYLVNRGRCRYCGGRIPIECLFAELAGAFGFLVLGLRFGLAPETLLWLLAGSILLVLSLIDMHTQTIPDKLLLALLAVRILFLFLLREPLKTTIPTMLLGAVSVSVPLLLLVLLMDRLTGKETMGGGDIKLLFVLGLYHPWPKMLLTLLLGCVLALLSAPVLKKQQSIPFGPFLSLAFLLAAVAGDSVLGWYLGLF